MVSSQNVRAPFPVAVTPLLRTALPDRETRQRTWLERTYSSVGDEPPGSTEVVVKNTFIHVADVAQPVMRSRSASDLGSSASSAESDIRLVNSASIAPSSVSSASSTGETPVGPAHPNAFPHALGNPSSTSFSSDRPRRDVAPSAPSHAAGGSPNDRPVGDYHSSARSHAPVFACSTNPICDRPYEAYFWNIPSRPPHGASNDRLAADFHSNASSHAPGVACSTNPSNVKTCGGEFWYAPSHAPDGTAHDSPDCGPHSSIPRQASGTAQSASFANNRPSRGTTSTAPHDAAGRASSERFADSRPGTGTPSTVPWPSSVGAPPTDAENEFFPLDEIQEQDETGEWSNGSANHDAGDCSPCFYYRSKSGCRNGRSCMFCHLPHVLKPRVRPSKAKRDQCKQIATMLGTAIPENPEPIVDTVCSTRKEKAYLLAILKGKARAQHEERWEQLEVDSSGGSSNQNDVRHQAAGVWKMSL